jgi:hypothetical protein
MKALFLRDLRRLAPVAGAVQLGIFLMILIGRLRDEQIDAASVAAAGSALGALLLGVATVAPDTDSGAVAFLARLPISPSRALAAKVAAATFWVGAIAAISTASTGMPDGLWHDHFKLGQALAVALASGVLASVASPRTLPAMVLAPIIAGLAWIAFVAPVLLIFWMRAVLDPGAPLVLGFSAAGIAIAFVAFARGDRHRASWRPAALALAGVILVDVLSVTSAALAHGWNIHEAPRWMSVRGWQRVESADGSIVALVLEGERWAGFESRIAIVDRVQRSARLLPLRYAEPIALSPDGKRLLAGELSEQDPVGGWLVDLETGSVERLETAVASSWVIWGARPMIVREGNGAFELCDPRGVVVAKQASTGHIVGTVGDRVAVLDQNGLSLLDPTTGRSEMLIAVETKESDLVDAAISPRGERAVLVVSRPEDHPDRNESTFHVLDRSTGARRKFDSALCVDHGFGRTPFSPDLSKIVLSSGQESFVVDLDRGEAQTFASTGERGAGHPAWSPDGARLALPWGEVRDLASGKGWRGPHAIGAFVTSEVGVTLSEPLAFVDAVTGAVLARPLEER